MEWRGSQPWSERIAQLAIANSRRRTELKPSVSNHHNGAITSVTELYARYIDWAIENRPDDKWAKVLKDWQCPLSLFAMREPAVANDGRFYELKQIEAHNQRGIGCPGGLKSPVTQVPMSDNVTLCPTAKSQMQAWVEADIDGLTGTAAVAKLEETLGIEPGTDLSAEGTRGVHRYARGE